jgi:hypothetical protein
MRQTYQNPRVRQLSQLITLPCSQRNPHMVVAVSKLNTSVYP